MGATVFFYPWSWVQAAEMVRARCCASIVLRPDLCHTECRLRPLPLWAPLTPQPPPSLHLSHLCPLDLQSTPWSPLTLLPLPCNRHQQVRDRVSNGRPDLRYRVLLGLGINNSKLW